MYPCHKNARAAVIALIKWLIHASYLLYLYPESHIPEPQWPAVSVNSCGWVVHSCGLKHLECFPVFLLSDVVWISQNSSDEMATCMTQALFDASFFGNSFRSFGFFYPHEMSRDSCRNIPAVCSFCKMISVYSSFLQKHYLFMKNVREGLFLSVGASVFRSILPRYWNKHWRNTPCHGFRRHFDE